MPAITKVRGTLIYIGTTASVASTDTYVEITGAKVINGEIGGEAAEIDATVLADTYKQAVKGVMDAGDLTIGGNYNHADAGQTALATAAAVDDDGVYNFKLVQPNARIRYVKARVFGFKKAYGNNTALLEFRSKLSLTAEPTETAAA